MAALAAALMLFLAGDVAAASFRIAPPPPWVEPLPVEPADPPAGQTSGGVDYLLVDEQTRVGPRPRVAYAHYAKKILNESGLEGSSQLSFDFDPAYQSLDIHSVRLWRDGASSERLARRRIKVLQREPKLEQQIYDGTLSAVLFLDDLRVGDVLEWAYTLTGANPIFDGLYFDSFDVEWSVPLHRWRRRLLWPEGRPLYVRNHGTSLSPSIRGTAGGREYVWERRQVPAVLGEKGLPAWFDPRGWVQLSELGTWAEVAAWGNRLFVPPATLSRPLAQRIEGWRELPSDEDRLTAALRFVQDEVRYLGMEMGVNSHRPSRPDTVFKRRFGDCKDKALLLVTILQRLGIEAHPALVSTVYAHTLDDWQPTPLAFNHTVVRVELRGQSLWLDATRGSQGGRPGHVYFPSYGRALVLQPGATALIPIPDATLAAPSTVIRESYRVDDYAGPAELRVETRYMGRDADRLRADFKESSRAEIAKRYLDFYARNYPAIRSQAPIEMRDDREANVVVTDERYLIPGFWTVPPGKSQKQADLYALSIDEVVSTPGAEVRATPLAVPHPVYVRQVTELSLPSAWNVTPEDRAVTSKGLRFSFRSKGAQRGVTLEYELRSLADSVAPRDVKEHVAAVDRIRDSLSYSVWIPLRELAPAPSVPLQRVVRWVPVGLAALATPPFLLIAVGVYLYRPSAAAVAPAEASAVPDIRGWLVLPALGVFLTPVRLLAAILGTPALYSFAGGDGLPAAGTEGIRWVALLSFELLANVFLLVYSLLLVVLLVQKRRTFPLLFVLFMVLDMGIIVLDLTLTGLMRGRTGSLGSWAMAAARLVPVLLWTSYFLVSRRVKATFVR